MKTAIDEKINISDVNFDKTYAQRTPKDVWVSEHTHLGTAEELSAKHDELNDVKQEEAKKAKTAPSTKA